MIYPAVIAAAAASSPPVEIRRCELANPFGFVGMVPAAVRVVFVDRTNVAANEVAFTITYYRYRDKDVTLTGTFSPGVAIEHIFPEIVVGELYPPQDIQCALREVRFTDGTVRRFGSDEIVFPRY
jgi:hypothetical protein